jgi:hypothetical protein
MLDILDIRTQLPAPASFLPLVEQRAFWIGQAIPASALLLFGLGLCIRSARNAGQPQRILKQERRILWKKIDGSNNRPEVLHAAVRLLELDSRPLLRGKAITQPRPLNELISEGMVPEDLQSEVRTLLETREATFYGHVGPESLSEEERSKIKTLLNRWKATA